MKNGVVWNAAAAVESLGCRHILQKIPLNTELNLVISSVKETTGDEGQQRHNGEESP